MFTLRVFPTPTCVVARLRRSRTSNVTYATNNGDKAPTERRAAIARQTWTASVRRLQKQRAITTLIEVETPEIVVNEFKSDILDNPSKDFERLEELKEFYARHGNTSVPTGSSLGNWLTKMRMLKRRGKLTQDIIMSLNTLGLEWEPMQRRKYARVEELQAFKQEHGHIQIPTNSSLNRWIRRQRVLKRENKLDANVIRAMEELGVVWEPRMSFHEQNEKIWRARIEDLKTLKSQDGKLRPTNSYPHAMKSWLYHQTRLFREGKLSAERCQELRELGVVLKMTNRVSWDGRLVELIEFKRMNGHCNVPATWRHNKELGFWVGTQRKYKRAGKLSEERVAALTSLGFEWEPKKAVSRMKNGLRAKASPWTVSSTKAHDEGPRVEISWIGGTDKESTSEETFLWGRASKQYEEKQQVVFDDIEKWWQEGASINGSPQSMVIGMRLNHRIGIGKHARNIKPDILLEISSPALEKRTWGLVVEVDEFAHRRGSKSNYDWTSEESRMRALQCALAVPLKIVRFNPDPTTDDDRKLEDRIVELIDHLERAVVEPPIRDLEVSYLAYD